MLGKVLHISEIVLPIFLIIAMGYGIVRTGVVTRAIADNLSKLSFYLSLPILLFLSISQPGTVHQANGSFLLAANLVVALFFTLVFAVASVLKVTPEKKGVIVQATYRSNMAYVGLPVCLNAFGPDNFPRTALFLAFLVPLYNLLAVLALSLARPGAMRRAQIKQTMLKIIKNPLIAASILGIVFSLFNIRIHPILKKALTPVGKAAMPMALISVGCSMSLHLRATRLKTSLVVAMVKLVLYPLAAMLVLQWLDFDQTDVQVAVVILGCPVAVASYVMAREMGGDYNLAGDTVMLTTLLSVFTLSGWLFFLL